MSENKDRLSADERRAQREVLRALADTWQKAVQRDRANSGIHHSQALSMEALRERLGETFDAQTLDQAVAKLLVSKAIRRLPGQEQESYAMGDAGWNLIPATDRRERELLMRNDPSGKNRDRNS